MYKDIENYEGLYQVNKQGDVRAIKRSGSKGKSLKLNPTKGYLQVWLSKNNKTKRHSVHRLVAQTFIPNPENKSQVNHIDGNKTNNHVENLEWVTRAEQEAHKRDVLGHDSKGSRNGNYGYRHSKLYPSADLRNKLCELGIPRYKHNLVELGEMLPIKVFDSYHQIRTIKIQSGVKGEWQCAVYNVITGSNVEYFEEDTEANARAKALIWLIENGHLDVTTL